MPEELLGGDQAATGADAVAGGEVVADAAASTGQAEQDAWSRQVGNTTYTAADRDRLAGDYENLLKDHTRKSQTWNDAQALEARLNEIKGGTSKEPQMTAEEKAFDEYMNQRGYARKDDLLKDVMGEVKKEFFARDTYGSIREFAKGTGSGDLPVKADEGKLVEFMTENGIRNPEHAYQIMYKDDIRKAIADDVLKTRPRTIHTERANATTRVTATARDPKSKSYLQDVWDDIQADREQ